MGLGREGRQWNLAHHLLGTIFQSTVWFHFLSVQFSVRGFYFFSPLFGGAWVKQDRIPLPALCCANTKQDKEFSKEGCRAGAYETPLRTITGTFLVRMAGWLQTHFSLSFPLLKAGSQIRKGCPMYLVELFCISKRNSLNRGKYCAIFSCLSWNCARSCSSKILLIFPQWGCHIRGKKDHHKSVLFTHKSLNLGLISLGVFGFINMKGSSGV